MDNTHKIALFIFCWLFPFWLIAQEVTIKGTVKDEDGLELPGAAIVIKLLRVWLPIGMVTSR